MKKISLFFTSILVAAASLLSVSCIGDLNVTPIDPDVDLPDSVLNSVEAYEQLLAKCYVGLAVSASQGPDTSPDIDGIDGGFGQYMRALFNLNEVTTDEAIIVWNDQTIHDLANVNWTTSDIFITAMFSRIFYQVSVCNEFIRRAQASKFADDQRIKDYIAEARALRALSYWHAIDMFGNVPFTTEENSVGSTAPGRIERADLYEWLVNEIKDFTPLLKPAMSHEYGRVDQGFAHMLLAKLYLNAEVYTNKNVSAWSECAELCKTIISEYGGSLYNEYEHLFLADNHLRRNEIIFAVESDGTFTQSYGSVNFVIKSSNPSGETKWQAALGVNDGWGGIIVTPEFLDKFETGDKRFLFTDGSAYVKASEVHTRDCSDPYNFKTGWCSMKFKNLKSDGSAASSTAFPDTDYPVFRTADAYLMLAECELHGAVSGEGLNAFNEVRKRAGVPVVTKLTEDIVLDERGREFYFENLRRQDLIRFGKYTSSDYVWAWKGGVLEGRGVDEKFNLFPIPTTELNVNENLKPQNPGY